MSNQNQTLQRDQVAQQISNLLLTYPDLQDDEQLRHDMLEGSTTAFEYVEQQLKMCAEKKALLKGLDDYIKVLKERSERIEHAIEMHRNMVRRTMEQAQLMKLKLPMATVSISTGRPKILISDIDLLPDECKRVIVEANKIAIAAKFSAGEQVPGASLSNGEPYLLVKFK